MALRVVVVGLGSRGQDWLRAIQTAPEFELAAGAGFIVPIVGEMMRMPGLPAIPASEGMDIDDQGNITGLS